MKLLSTPKIEGASYRIAMAFEDNKHYRKFIDEIKSSLEKVTIEVLLINENKEVLYYI